MLDYQKRHKRYISKINQLGLVSLITSIGLASVGAIWAVYIRSFVNSNTIVGYLTAFFTFLSVFSYFFFIPLIEKYHPSRVYFIALLFNGISYLLFAINENFIFFIFIATGLTIFSVLRIETFGVMIKEESHLKDIGKNESFIYSLTNLGWLVGPLLAGFVTEKQGFSRVFILAFVFIIISLITFKLSKIRDKIKNCEIHNNIKTNLVNFLKDKCLLKLYFISGGLSVWWSLIYIFIPLYIITKGYSMISVGYFIFGVNIPLVMLEYFFGRKIEKIGYKKYFIIGYGILGLAALISFFLNNTIIIIIVLCFASIGAAMLEPTRESYFFKSVRKKDEQRFYGPFMTTVDVHNTIGRIILATVTLILPYKWIFMIMAVLMFVYTYYSTKLTKCRIGLTKKG